MSEFRVYIEGLRQKGETISGYKSRLENAATSIEQTMYGLGGNQFEGVKNVLRTQATNIRIQANKVQNLGQGLQAIANLYQSTEFQIMGLPFDPNVISDPNNGSTVHIDFGDTPQFYPGPEGPHYGPYPPAIVAGDPVNMATGNFIHDHEELSVPGEIPLTFHWYYNGKDKAYGKMGIGFTHLYETRLYVQPDGSISIRMGNGQQKKFALREDGKYYSNTRDLEILEEKDNRFFLTAPNGQKHIFDAEGNCIRTENKNQLGYQYFYNEKKELAKVETDHGDYLLFSYGEDGFLDSVMDHTGRGVTISYENHVLSKIRLQTGATYQYKIDELGRMVQIVNSKNAIAVTNAFDKENRVTVQTFFDGRTMQYFYDEKRNALVFIERNGSTVVYYHDEYLRNTKIAYEDETEELFDYNDLNLCTGMTDRMGNRKQMAYDNRGNLTQLIDALGNKSNFTYDANNQILCVKYNGKEVSKFDYDRVGNLLRTYNFYGDGSQIVRDEKGRIKTQVFIDGAKTDYEYDAKGNLICKKSDSGEKNEYAYDSNNRVIKHTDSYGNVTEYEYDEANHVTKQINALGHEKSFGYDLAGNLVCVTDFDGYETRYQYNEMNQMVKSIDKEGNETSYQYDAMWNLAKITYADGSEKTATFDMDNRLRAITLPEGGVLRYTYDANGNIVSVIDPMGNETLHTYDALNRRVQTIFADGTKEEIHYDSNGNISKRKLPYGNEQLYFYDELNRKISEINQLQDQFFFEYDVNGNIVKKVYPDKTFETAEYANGHLIHVRARNGGNVYYKYDLNGNLLSIDNSLTGKVEFTYDACNRMVKAVSGNGGIRTYEYDKAGRIIKTQDENGHVTAFEFSPNGNVTKVIEEEGLETRYFYDVKNHLIRVEHSDGEGGFRVLRSYEYDKEDHIISWVDALGATEKAGYDKNGQLIRAWDKEGYLTTYTYNKVGDVEKVLFEDGKETTFTYLAHVLQSMQDWNGITNITTDALGRPVSVSNYLKETVTYQWGKTNELTEMVYPDGEKVTYSYNELGQLSKLGTKDQGVTYTYDEAGRMVQKSYTNGSVTSYTYNEIGRYESIVHKGKDYLDQYEYQYDLKGNKTGMRKNRSALQKESGMYTFGYDALNRLTCVSKDGETLRDYAYDVFGNRISKKEKQDDGFATTTYYYNEANQLLKEETTGNVKKYEYDRRGNMICTYLNDAIKSQFEYDATNHISKAIEKKADSFDETRIFYDGFLRKIGETKTKIQENGGEAVLLNQVSFLNDIMKPTMYLIGTSDDVTSQKQNYYGTKYVEMYGTKDASYVYETDDLGSITQIVGQQGSLEEVYDYDEFGNSTTYAKEDGAIFIARPTGIYSDGRQPYGYTGYQKEIYANFYYTFARCYDASAGRFVGEDKIKGFPQIPYTYNSYCYCISNPLIYVDEDGEFWHVVVGAVVGVVVNVASEVITEVQEGSFDITSADTWKKIGVSTLTGAAEGAITSLTGPVGGAITSGVMSIVDSTSKQVVCGEEITWGKNIAGGILAGGLSFGLSKLGDVPAVKKFTDNVSDKIDNFIFKGATSEAGFIPTKEIDDDMLKWLGRYAADKAHPDAKDALKLVNQAFRNKLMADPISNLLPTEVSYFFGLGYDKVNNALQATSPYHIKR